MNITKDTLIVDIIRSNPKSVDVFKKFNMGCVSCGGVVQESLDKGCLMHGQDVKAIIKDLENLK